MWCSSSKGLAVPLPFSRARTIDRPGPESYRFTGMPSRSRMRLRKSAAFNTSPGGFDVLIRT